MEIHPRQIIPYSHNDSIIEKNNNKSIIDKSNIYKSINRLVINKKIQIDSPISQTITPSRNLRIRIKKVIPKIDSYKNTNNAQNKSLNKENINVKLSTNRDNSINNNNKNKSYILSNNKEIKEHKIKENNINDEKLVDNNKLNINNNIKTKDKKYNSRNKPLIIKKSTFEMENPGYIDKSIQNWNELKKNYIEHVTNQEILKKNEKINTDKYIFNPTNYRKFYFGRKNVQGLPYFYDITSTYMNIYQNKSEHNRHEILINELCRLRAYLLKYKNKNNTDIVKDFLIKHNIHNINKYTNYQLLQFERFVCQEDIYKINSLLKPYMHVKDMINDILENSENFNKKFTSFKFNSSIKNLLTNKSQPILIGNNKNFFTKTVKPKNINKNKFYISELDYQIEKNDSKNSNDTQNVEVINGNTNNINENEEKKIFENNEKDFNLYSEKRKAILKNIGISKKNFFKNIDNKESYFSPLFNINTFHRNYERNARKIKLPKITNSIGSFYKPNKLLLSPDKNYSLNFQLLYKDITNELNNFQSNYERKFDVDIQKDVSKNMSQSKSCENILRDDNLIRKKLEENNRLFFGKKNIKANLEEIQRKHKLTEYIALINAKNHIKNEIINEDVIKF